MSRLFPPRHTQPTTTSFADALLLAAPTILDWAIVWVSGSVFDLQVDLDLLDFDPRQRRNPLLCSNQNI
jgi:hypothetical protein